jgi:hypothetical protein
MHPKDGSRIEQAWLGLKLWLNLSALNKIRKFSDGRSQIPTVACLISCTQIASALDKSQ